MYLFDANVFIDAARRYYAPDIAPTFWDWLTEQHSAGQIASVASVFGELCGGGQNANDFLAEWAISLPRSFWAQADGNTATSLQELATWVVDNQRPYTQAAKEQFLSIADYFLVAQAHASGHQVVTFELPQPRAKKRVLIPDACSALGVGCKQPFEVYRELGLRFN